MSNPKVFEFAKEVGLSPLALMNKIREWQLPVKSHMSELDPEVLQQIKVRLQEASKSSSGAVKKPAVRKKAAAPAAAPPAPITSSRKAKAVVEETPAPPKPAAVGSIVRRKKTAELEAAKAEALRTEVQKVEPTKIEEPAEPLEVEAKTPMAATPTPEVVAASEPEVVPPVVAAAPSEPVDKKFVSRKKEVSIGSSGVTTEPSAAAAAVKRNIVGRMDLSRVSPPPRPQGGPGGGRYQGGQGGPGGPRGSAGPSGFGANRSGGNLRAGFIKASPGLFDPPPPVGDFDQRRKEDRKRPRPGGGPVEEVNRVSEEQPQVFDASEFRKREMVFQPRKKKGTLNRPSMQTQITKPAAHKRLVKVFGSMRLSDLAVELGVKAAELIKLLMKNGVAGMSMNSELDFDTIALIVPELGFEAQNVKKTAEEVLQSRAAEDAGETVSRPPVVTVMGHVDHGKTSLLDSIREANVAKGEAGGITQHIGAYQVTLKNGRQITFLDTPGHEAFTAMRARGAKVTDIAIIVVAADDGVMPQTVEAVNHARAAGVPLIVAVNKIDKPGANIDRIKQQLTEHQVVPEEWGGDAIYAPVSALKGTGIQELLDQILLVAEVADLKASVSKMGMGAVIESRLDKGRGPVATLLVQDGTISVGQHLVAGVSSGRVRSLVNDRGERVNSAGPGTPVEVLGLDGVPQAGDRFDVVKDEKVAQEVAQIRRDQQAALEKASHKPTLEQIMARMNRGEQKDLGVILKADVAGSLEAIQGMFAKVTTAEVKIKILHAALGGITESDVLLASTAQALILGFNVRPDASALAEAKRRNVEIRTYTIVYELMDDMKKAMSGLLQPDLVEKVQGHAEVRNIFNIPKVGTIAGCFVQDGRIQRNNMVRLLRGGKIIYTGQLASLKRFKDDAKEVAQGFECGIGIENYNDLKVGDIVEAFVKEEVVRELGPAIGSP